MRAVGATTGSDSLRAAPHGENAPSRCPKNVVTKVNISTSAHESLLPTACNLLLDHNKDLEYVQLSGCKNGVDDKVMKNIAKLSNLSFLDLSYCKQITDEGIKAFADKKYPLETLIINGCNGITGEGLKQWLLSFQADL